MAYAPPIAKRKYLNTLKNSSGKLISNECARCRRMKEYKDGMWFEHHREHDSWYWVCKGCK